MLLELEGRAYEWFLHLVHVDHLSAIGCTVALPKSSLFKVLFVVSGLFFSGVPKNFSNLFYGCGYGYGWFENSIQSIIYKNFQAQYTPQQYR
jgi:hypothetical protein